MVKGDAERELRTCVKVLFRRRDGREYRAVFQRPSRLPRRSIEIDLASSEISELSDSVSRLLREQSGLIFSPKIHLWRSPRKSDRNAALRRAVL